VEPNRSSARRRGRPLAKLAALLAASLAATTAVAESQCLDDVEVCLDVSAEGAVVRFVAANRTQAPQSFRIALRELGNLRPLGAAPFRAVLEPGEQRLVGSLAARDPELPIHYRYEWGAAHGSLLARHDDGWRYRMPFGGDAPRPVGQGVGGSYSHQGPSRYAFDFTMPWGTPVLAARGGVVVAVRDDARASRAMRRLYDKANAVEVLHADGTIATYAHLQRGALVEVGQRVVAGERVGLSGDTGFSTGPHLHFMVWRRTADLQWTTVPIRFDDGSAAGFLPRTGLAYAPACRPGAPGCAPEGSAPAQESWPAARGSAGEWIRRSDGACVCPNGATIHVDLPCQQVCAH
jgi:murein DD-endopeptidase MepM/ murein hydrolase activator NlpD